jgi:hypothetical protein
MSSAETKPDTETPPSFDTLIDAVLAECDREQESAYSEIKTQVHDMYEELNRKLLDLYAPVVEACRKRRDNRNHKITQVVESSLSSELKRLITNNNTFRFDPDDLKEHLFVHVWMPEFERTYPYAYDPTCADYSNIHLKMSIQVCFPAVAQEKITGRIIALTVTDIEDQFLDSTPLKEQDSTVTRARDCITFEFEYIERDLPIQGDEAFCEYPVFPTRPLPKTR